MGRGECVAVREVLERHPSVREERPEEPVLASVREIKGCLLEQHVECRSRLADRTDDIAGLPGRRNGERDERRAWRLVVQADMASPILFVSIGLASMALLVSHTCARPFTPPNGSMKAGRAAPARLLILGGGTPMKKNMECPAAWAQYGSRIVKPPWPVVVERSLKRRSISA